MENPIIKIESDGQTTEVYIDGKKIDLCTEFDFHADSDGIRYTYRNYKRNALGNPLVIGNELVSETHEFTRG